MNVTGTLLGSNVTMVETIVNGLEIYAVFIDSSNNLNVSRLNYNPTLSGTPVLAGAVSVA